MKERQSIEKEAARLKRVRRRRISATKTNRPERERDQGRNIKRVGELIKSKTALSGKSQEEEEKKGCLGFYCKKRKLKWQQVSSISYRFHYDLTRLS